MMSNPDIYTKPRITFIGQSLEVHNFTGSGRLIVAGYKNKTLAKSRVFNLTESSIRVFNVSDMVYDSSIDDVRAYLWSGIEPVCLSKHS
ncbi:MAG: hypothetical protein KIG65_05790 [Eubacteriales bacterium]|nr:hypothetical protein [Eubacteriales bacterium]